MRVRVAETDVAARVMEWLVHQGWDVYPEVRLSYGSPRADIVALEPRLNLLRVVETKTNFGWSVVEQALYWIGLAHWVHIAVPAGSAARLRACARRCLKHEGIGLIRVYEDLNLDVEERCCEDIPAHLHRRIMPLLRDRLHAGHKQMGVAGSRADYFTPFKATVAEAERFVGRNPGCTIRELLAGIEYHWASDATARACVAKYLGRGILGRIEVVAGSRPFRLRLQENNHG